MTDNITTHILDLLAKSPDNHISISYLQELLRGPMPGSRRCFGPFPHFPTNHTIAMDTLRDLGFTIVKGRKRRFTWEVTV